MDRHIKQAHLLRFYCVQVAFIEAVQCCETTACRLAFCTLCEMCSRLARGRFKGGLNIYFSNILIMSQESGLISLPFMGKAALLFTPLKKGRE